MHISDSQLVQQTIIVQMNHNAAAPEQYRDYTIQWGSVGYQLLKDCMNELGYADKIKEPSFSYMGFTHSLKQYK